MFLRLMVLIAFIKQFMLLELPAEIWDNEPPDDVDPYAELDELAVLHARAMLHMHQLSWPIGGLHDVPVPLGRFVTVYEKHFGVSTMSGILFMRSGAIYGTVEQVVEGGRRRHTKGLLDLALLDDETRGYIALGLNSLLELQPELIYIDG